MRRRLFLILVAAAALAPLARGERPATASEGFPGWPASWEGRPLRAVALTQIEARFARSFPGRMARFEDGARHITIRWIAAPSRRVHPAGECFRAWGFEIASEGLARDAEGATWSVFLARRGDEAIRVRERIFDGAGASWSDLSAWYWAARLGRTTGPWWCVSVAEREPLLSAGDLIN